MHMYSTPREGSTRPYVDPPKRIKLPLRGVFSSKERKLNKLRNELNITLQSDLRTQQKPFRTLRARDMDFISMLNGMDEETLRMILRAYGECSSFTCIEELYRRRDNSYLRFVATFFETARKEKSTSKVYWDKIARGVVENTKQPLSRASDGTYHHALVKLMVQTNRYPGAGDGCNDLLLDEDTNEFLRSNPELIDDYIDVAYERKMDVLDINADFYRHYRDPASATPLVDGVL